MLPVLHWCRAEYWMAGLGVFPNTVESLDVAQLYGIIPKVYQGVFLSFVTPG